jgi:hypothetical protein
MDVLEVVPVLVVDDFEEFAHTLLQVSLTAAMQAMLLLLHLEVPLVPLYQIQ